MIALIVCIGWIFSLCLHEFGHAIVAYWGGDKSVKEKGYLTFNPLKYTDPGLSLALPLFFLLLGGIALPGGAVYIDRSRLRSRLWDSGVSAAGPFASFLAALGLSFPFWSGWIIIDRNTHWFWSAIAFLIFIDIYVVLINLLPIPPLDGYGIIDPWLPLPLQKKCRQFGKYGLLILIALLWFFDPLNQFLWFLSSEIGNLLRVPPQAIYMGGQLFRQNSGILVVGILAALWIFRSKEQRLYQKGENFSRLKQYDRAIAAYDRAIEIKPDYYEAWRNKTHLLHHLQWYEEALAGYERLKALQPKAIKDWQYQGLILSQLQRHEEALEFYDFILAKDPQDQEFWYRKGLILHALQRDEEVLPIIAKIVAIDADKTETWSMSGILWEKLGNREEACKSYEKITELKPYDYQSWYQYGKFLQRSQCYEEAIAYFDTAIQRNPTESEVWYAQAICYARQDRKEEALDRLEEALTLKGGEQWQETAKNDENFVILQESPRFQKLIGVS
ncbi:MAG: tetratricopeptide repeat protein [Cyanobacteria bacterium SBLK]|nr:tetratricopeptide repeat protein [Cyanobacteria bacterium SBLK]